VLGFLCFLFLAARFRYALGLAPVPCPSWPLPPLDCFSWSFSQPSVPPRLQLRSTFLHMICKGETVAVESLATGWLLSGSSGHQNVLAPPDGHGGEEPACLLCSTPSFQGAVLCQVPLRLLYPPPLVCLFFPLVCYPLMAVLPWCQTQVVGDSAIGLAILGALAFQCYLVSPFNLHVQTAFPS